MPTPIVRYRPPRVEHRPDRFSARALAALTCGLEPQTRYFEASGGARDSTSGKTEVSSPSARVIGRNFSTFAHPTDPYNPVTKSKSSPYTSAPMKSYFSRKSRSRRDASEHPQSDLDDSSAQIRTAAHGICSEFPETKVAITGRAADVIRSS